MKAWELIEQTGWCQGTYARSADGTERKPHAADAVCYCLYGAILRVYRGPDVEIKLRKVEEVLGRQLQIPDCSPVIWQDDPMRTKEDVVTLLKEADV